MLEKIIAISELAGEAMLCVAIFSGFALPHATTASELWNESRHFERSLEKAMPEMMKYIMAAHISEQGLEVQVSLFYPINVHERNRLYKQVSELWKNSEFVKAKKYPGKVQFMQLDMPLKTVD